MKKLKFIGTSEDDLANFPPDAKRAVGFELWQVQIGAMPSDFKPMPGVGSELTRSAYMFWASGA